MSLPRSLSLLSLVVPLTTTGEVQTLEEIVVTATAIKEEKVEGSGTKLKAEKLLSRGSVTLPDALQREPGVSVPLDIAGGDALVPYLQGGSQGINIRGLQGDRIELLVDGIPQPDDSTTRTFAGSGGPGRIYFDPAVFADLNLFKSGSPGSGALAGTLAGRTESPLTLLGPGLDGFRLKSNTNYASVNDSWNERLATAWGNGTYATSLVYSFRTGHEIENNGGIPANPSDAESHAFVWKNLYRKNDWTFEQTFDYFHSTSFTNLLSVLGPSAIGTTTNATNDASRERLRLSFDFQNDRGFTFADELSGKLYYQTSESKNLNIQDLINPVGDLRNRINRLNYNQDIAGLNLTARKDLGDHSLTARYLGSRKDISGALLRTDQPLPEDNLPNLAPSIVWDHALSVVDKISFGDKWTLTPSVRVHHYQVNPTNTADFLEQSKVAARDEFGRLLRDENGNQIFRIVEATDYDNLYLSPSLHLRHQTTNELSFFGSYTRGFRNPTAEELGGVFVHPDDVSITLPNPDLEAEDSHAFEIGLDYEGERWSHNFSVYYNRYGNFLESGVRTGEESGGLDVLRTENTQNVEIYGVELKSEYLADHYRVGGTLAWSQGTSDDGPLNTVEPLKAVAWFAYEPSDNWGVELSGTFVAAKTSSQISANRITEEKPPGTDAYFLLDLTGYYHISENLTFRGGLKNILDEEYVLWSRANRAGGHDGGASSNRNTQPGINGFVSLELEF